MSVFHVEHHPIVVEHRGEGLADDWRVERRPDGYAWFVTDWTDELIAYGVRTSQGEAVAECVRWSTSHVPRGTPATS